MAKYYVRFDDHEMSVDIAHTQQGTVVRMMRVEQADEHKSYQVDFAPVHISPHTGEGLYSLILDGKSYQLFVERMGDGYRIALWRYRFDLKVLTEREWRLQKVAPRQAAHAGRFVVAAPMPGLVKSVVVGAGDHVAAGQRLVVLEAMKMENDIVAPRDGTVAQVHVEAGTVVEGGKPLITIE